ncbi:unnamed protein product [Sphagnum balticum]
MLLELRKLHTQTPLNCPPSCEDSPTHEMTHLLGGAAGRWWKYLRQPTIATLAAVTVVLTLFLSSVFVNQQAAMTSVMEKLTSPFKDCGKCAVTRTQCTNGGELLPKGIIVGTSDLQMRTLAVEDEDMVMKITPKNLLAMAVGINQKEGVDQIVQKVLDFNFTIMLFHYDGITDQWNDLPWYNQSIHIVALHQTKWWYAKRFMHPDIVEQYNYIFLWDEDLGVENFNASRYVQIMEEDGMEISQPALDPASLDIHHGITLRRPKNRSHKRIYKARGLTLCTEESNGPPCTGWVEVMAPVFSRAAWRCTWHMIQNDLVHGWGLDFKIGYCSQGIRSEKVGVIDDEYVLHKGIPSLGGPHNNRVRRRSGAEMKAFLQRWRNAVKADPDWIDPYKTSNESSQGYHTR